MASKLAQFPHRQDGDGMYHSICSNCFATVARSKPEAVMADLEKAHVCNPSYLANDSISTVRSPGTRPHLFPASPIPHHASPEAL